MSQLSLFFDSTLLVRDVEGDYRPAKAGSPNRIPLATVAFDGLDVLDLADFLSCFDHRRFPSRP